MKSDETNDSTPSAARGSDLFRLKILDRDGAGPVSEIRSLFEVSVQQTPVLHNNLDMVFETKDGRFSHYLARTTDLLWSGFALGVRCAERICAVEIDRPETASATVADQVKLVDLLEEVIGESDDKFWPRAIRNACSGLELDEIGEALEEAVSEGQGAGGRR